MNRVVEALEHAGAPGISIVEIHPVGYGYEPNYFVAAADAFKRYAHFRIVKMEVVCMDEDWARFADVIREECGTGNPGDGMIFVSHVVDAIRIRDGAEGSGAL